MVIYIFVFHKLFYAEKENGILLQQDINLIRKHLRIQSQEQTHFGPMFQFYTPWKHEKPKDFWYFQGV